MKGKTLRKKLASIRLEAGADPLAVLTDAYDALEKRVSKLEKPGAAPDDDQEGNGDGADEGEETE